MHKTLVKILDPKQVSNFSRYNQYLHHLNVRAQHENFNHMIASPFNSEPHFGSWGGSTTRGSNDMMNTLNDKVGKILAPKNKANVVDTKKQIMFSY